MAAAMSGSRMRAADIEKGAEQQQEDADGRGAADRRPHAADVVDRPRVADDERVAGFAAGAEIFHGLSSLSRANRCEATRP